MQKLIFSIVFWVGVSMGVWAQMPAKKSITTDDFASWNTISGTQISNNGKYVVFEQNPLKGDGKLLIKQGGSTKTLERGYKAQIGSENDVVVFHIKPQTDTIRAAKKNKVKKEKLPKDNLGIYLLKKDEILSFSKVKSFKLPENNARWLAALLEKKEEKDKKKKQVGDDLLLFNIHNRDTIRFNNIVEYSWAKEGSAMVFVQQTSDSLHTYSTVKWFNAQNGKVSDVISDIGWVKNASMNASGNQCAYLMSKDTIDEKVYALFLSSEANEPKEVVNRFTSGMPVGWSPSENGKVNFSEDGTKLYLGTAVAPEVAPEDSLLAEEKPKVDVWSWTDIKIQPQQLVELEKEKKRTYLAVYGIDTKEFVQLADVNIPQVSTILKGNADIAFGSSDIPYKRASSWTGGSYRDYYLIDLKTGIKREIIKKKAYARLSPGGKYVIWWEPADSSYYCVSTHINDLENISLTKRIPVNFYNEWNDRPMDASPHGIAGWSEDDRFVYIYDRYDIWRIDASGDRVPACITKAFGRRNVTRFRYQKLDKELDIIPSGETVLLSAIDERTMSQGYFSTKFSSIKDPDLLAMDKCRFANVAKAKEADKLIWTKESIKMFPDVWCSDMEFDHAKKLSEANPQQKQYMWPTVELVEWTSFTGEKLKGLLYKPEKLKPNKKYPMIVYFYERSSETLHRHVYPKPSQSTINKTFYTSNNYLVFVPDITYRTGYPGQSAYDAIVSGTQHLIHNFDYVDEKNIGLQGQSWGGYQTAWLITQTDLYAAAMAGAPVSNMTSAYGGIRWGSGMSRMFQYEHTQSRIGGTLWEKPLHYIENSPQFYLPKVNTPLLIMHNDKDTAVPWYQGIELFVGLRRLDKPVWMLNYNNEPHNLPTKSWANRMDLSTRMFQFFNHYLKGKPAPQWMKKGIPAVEKGEDLGY